MPDRIGSFEMRTLRGPAPETVRRTLELVARPGVDGLVIVRTGTRGRPFVMRSGVDAASLDAGATRLRDYQAAIGSDPIEIIWGGKSWLDFNVRFVVLDVRLVQLVPIPPGGAVGGLNPPSLAWLECEWDLVPVSVAYSSG